MYTEKKDKVAAVFSYLGWIFWIVAFIIRNRDDELSKFHLSQGLTLCIAETIIGALTRIHGVIGFAAEIVAFGLGILSILGIVNAVRGNRQSLPFIGDINLL